MIKTEPKYQNGQNYTAVVQDVAYGGYGLAKLDGFTVFIMDAFPGEEVEIELTRSTRSHAFAKVIRVIHSSNQRIDPKCRYYAHCGGCQLQSTVDEYANHVKNSYVQHSFQRIGKVSSPLPLSPSISTQKWNYRNKIVLQKSSITNQYGLVKKYDSAIIPIDECPIANSSINETWKTIQPLLPKEGKNLAEKICIRATTTKQIAVIFYFSIPNESFMKKFSHQTQNEKFYVYSANLNKKSKPEPLLQIWKGPKILQENFYGISYEISPNSFFQIHPEGTNILIQEVLRWSKNLPTTKVLDLYCGVGLFSLQLAKSGFNTHGIDINPSAIGLAKESAQKNELQCTFSSGNIAKDIDSFKNYKNAILDPPRKGTTKEILHKLEKNGFENILYISCSPPSLARDAKVLLDCGYKMKKIQPVDLFPQTYHIETMVSFYR